jgi:predicted nucleotide-binding protein
MEQKEGNMEAESGPTDGGNLIMSLMHDLMALNENDIKGIDAFLRRTEMILRNLKLDEPYYKQILKSELRNTMRWGWQTTFSEARERVHNILQTVYEEWELFTKGAKAKAGATTEYSNRIFIVHGHDEGMREAVARVIEKLNFDPIILHEKPDKGRTIIQKFTEYSDVGFAIILLSPDDQGQKIGGGFDLKSRARQNVIFELGFFIGRLGPDRVLVIHREQKDFEFPSDYEGVLYTPYDHGGGWRHKIADELKAAGYSVDANKLTRE